MVSLTKSFRPPNGPGVYLAFNRNEYQERFLRCKSGRYVGLSPPCADCLEICELYPPDALFILLYNSRNMHITFDSIL
jgi:hypothetical protein